MPRPTTQVLRREAGRLVRRPSLIVLLFVAPLALTAFLAAIYTRGAAVELPFAVVDLDGSALSRTLVRAVDATRSLHVTATPASADDVQRLFLEGRIEGAMIIPRGLEADVRMRRPASVALYKSDANLITANLVLKDGVGAVRTISAGISAARLRAQGLYTPEAALALANPIRLETYSLFNPSYSYEWFMVPALALMLLQMVVQLGAAVLVSAEYTAGTFPDLVRAAGGSTWALLAGKSLPALALACASALALGGLVLPGAGLSLGPHPLATIAFLLYFTAAVFFPAFALSCLLRDPALATSIAIFLNTPAFIFSGYTYPLRAMPAPHQAFAGVLPFTHALSGLVKLYDFGLPLGALRHELLVLSLFLWPSIAIAGWALGRRAAGPSFAHEVAQA